MAKVNELVRIFMERDGMTKKEAVEYLADMRERVYAGDNPEEILYDEGLEPDYIFDLIG